MLVGKLRLAHRCAERIRSRTMLMYTEATWTGDRKSRGRTSGGRVPLGSHWLKSWDGNQAFIVLSPAGSELHPAVQATAGRIGSQSVTKRVGLP